MECYMYLWLEGKGRQGRRRRKVVFFSAACILTVGVAVAEEEAHRLGLV